VLDGDTFSVGGITVRLKGVAAPEVEHFGEAGDPCDVEAKAFMVELVGRRVGRCYVDGQDVAEALIRAGLARDCPRFSGGRYAAVEPAAARELRFPSYCSPR
jgi:micrococcal nuclease